MHPESVEVAGRPLEVWPPHQLVFALGSPQLLKTTFGDAEACRAGLTERILGLARERSLPDMGGTNVCGHKIHDPEAWGCPEADLVAARARALFRHVMNSPTAEVDNSWATLYLSGDFCLPHSHLRAEASIVYLLDPGDENPAWKGNGRLGFADPRLEACCPEQPGCMTAPQFPDLEPGDMLIFPGNIIHLVCPYHGERPRITLSWNLNRQPLPGARSHHAERRRRAAGLA